MKPICTALLLVATTLGAPMPLAQAQTEETAASLTPDEARRRVLFQEGKDAFRARKWELAYTKLSESWKIRRSFDVALVLAQTEYKVNRFAESAEHFSYYLRFVSAKEKEDIIATAREALSAAKMNVATVRLVAPRGAEITVDGRAVGTAPLDDAVFVAPGKRVFEARLGDAYVSKEFNLGIATEQELELVLPRSNAESAPGPSPVDSVNPSPAGHRPVTPRGEPPSYTPPAIAAAAAGTAVVSGIVFFVVASSKNSEREDLASELAGPNACGGSSPPSSCRRIADLSDTAAVYRALGYTSLGVGIASGVATYLLWPSANAAASGRASFRPLVSGSANSFTVGATGRF